MQVAERRVAGTEVVQLYLDARSACLPEGEHRGLPVLDECTLSDLQTEPPRIQARDRQDTHHLVHEFRMGDVLAGNVDAHGDVWQVREALRPEAHLAARLAYHPTIQGNDLPRVFREWDELRRRERAKTWVPP